MKIRFVITAAVLSAACLLTGNAVATLIPAITADVKDQEVYASPPHKFIGQSTARVGRGGPSGADAQLVMPFALPAIPIGEEVVSATLTFNLAGIAKQPSTPTDLADMNVYGIRSSVSATPVDADFLDVASLPSGAVLVQESIAIRASVPGVISTSAASDLNLGTWIQSLYDGGAIPGDFAFISFALSDPAATLGFRYYTITTANGASNQPTLSITSEVTAVPEPNSLAIIGLGFVMARALRRKPRVG